MVGAAKFTLVGVYSKLGRDILGVIGAVLISDDFFGLTSPTLTPT